MPLPIVVNISHHFRDTSHLIIAQNFPLKIAAKPRCGWKHGTLLLTI